MSKLTNNKSFDQEEVGKVEDKKEEEEVKVYMPSVEEALVLGSGSMIATIFFVSGWWYVAIPFSVAVFLAWKAFHDLNKSGDKR